MKIRVAIVDVHPIFRDGLKRLLETETDFVVVAEGADGRDALRIVDQSCPDVLLLDFALPDMNAIDVLAKLPHDATRVILVTAAIGGDDMFRVIRLGARGVVLKTSPPDLLFEGIRRAMEGKYVIESQVVGSLADAISRFSSQGSRPWGLTPRELEVSLAIADGASNQEVAQRLSIGVHTVKHHLTSIFDKTGVSSRLELAVFAMHRGLLDSVGRSGAAARVKGGRR